jgi:hypothetical protein
MSRSTHVALAVCAALAAASSASAQATQHAHPAAPMSHHMSGWKAMDAYHMLMMATWHPASGSNDLAPARAKADSLAAAAVAWAGSAVPAACDTKATRETIARVAADSRAFAALARTTAPDAQVKTALAALHDRFETVEKSCKPAAPHH